MNQLKVPAALFCNDIPKESCDFILKAFLSILGVLSEFTKAVEVFHI